MNQSSKNYSRLSSPEKASPQRKSEPETRCRKSVACRPEQVTANFRMVAVAIMMLFGFCVLLFVWNIVLWRELDRLQNDFVTLRRETEKTASTRRIDCDVIDTPLEPDRVEKTAEKRERSDRPETKFRKRKRDEPQYQVLEREKRNALEDVNDSPLHASAAFDAQQGLLSRIRRSPTTTGPAKGRKKGRGRRRRGNKPKPDRQGRNRWTMHQATALHVPIQGNIPYRGRTIDGDEGTIKLWNTRSALSEGFSVTNDGAEVLKDGVYFIYSQVTFKMAEGIEVHEKIFAGTTATSELSSCSNPIPQSNNSDYITCYSSGIKRMSAHDLIKVKVHPTPAVIFANPSYTYFGAFLIGS